MKYEFTVKPYADPTKIKVKVEGYEGISLANKGKGMIIKTGLGTEIRDGSLDVFYKDNKEDKIPAKFILVGNTYKFEISKWDKSRALIIDPLVYSTYLGGSYYDEGYGIAVDSNGCAYVAGYTESTDFPNTTGAYATSYNGNRDAFITKLSSDGSSLIYSTFLGGSNYEEGISIAVDSNGCAYGYWIYRFLRFSNYIRSLRYFLQRPLL